MYTVPFKKSDFLFWLNTGTGREQQKKLDVFICKYYFIAIIR